MEKIKGVIENVEITTGTGARGAWKKWAFLIEGKVYSTFTDIIGEKFKAGDFVEISGEQGDKYWNMTNMELVTAETEKANADRDKEYVKHGVKSPTSLAQDRTNSIVAQCMVKAAGYALSGRDNFTMDDVVTTTVQFTKAYNASKIELERTQD